MHPNATEKGLISFQRTSEIIESVRELDGARVNEVASHTDMASSTVHSHLATLEELGFLAKRGDEYHIGLRFLELGGCACHRREEFVLAKQKVTALARETKERAQYIVEEHGRGIYLSR